MAGIIDIETIRKLSVEQRLKLMETIWDTLADEDADVPIPQAALREMDRRLDELEANPGIGVPHAEMMKRLKGLRK